MAKLLLCEECNKAVSVYRCPRCSRRTCSLVCCQEHKNRTGCCGKRDRTAYLRKENMNNSTLQSDFLFLEDVLRTVHGSKRFVKEIGAHSNPSAGKPQLLKTTENNNNNDNDDDQNQRQPKRMAHTPLSPKWRRLVESAENHGITLLLMPAGMHRHDTNTSHYNLKRDQIFWKVEFVIHHHHHHQELHKKSAGRKYASREADDTTIQQVWNRAQHRGEDAPLPEGLFFLLKRLPCPSNAPQYKQVAPQATLKESLNGMTIYEHPTIEVVPTECLKDFPRLIEEME